METEKNLKIIKVKLEMKDEIIYLLKQYCKSNKISMEKYSKDYLNAKYRSKYTRYFNTGKRSLLISDEMAIFFLRPIFKKQYITKLLTKYYIKQIKAMY